MRAIDVNKLNKVFDIEKVQSEIKDMKETLDEISDNEELLDTNKILVDNINRANSFLDIIQESLESGSMSGPLLSAAAALMSVITNTAGSYVSNSINLEALDVKKSGLKLKEEELDIKRMVAEAKMNTQSPQSVNVTQNNQIITSSREDLLKMLSSPMENIIIDIPTTVEKIEK